MGLGGAVHAFVIPGIAFQLMPIIIGAVKADLGLSPEQLGAVPAFELGAMTLANLLGAWVIRTGRWSPLLWIGWALLIFGNFASALAPGATALLTCRFLAGCGGGFLSAVAAAALARTPSPERCFAAAAVAQAALSAACMVASPLLLKLGSWGAIFIAVGVLALPGLAVMHRVAVLRPSTDFSSVATNLTTRRWSMLVLWGPIGVYLSYLAMGMVWTYLGEVGSASGLTIEAVATGLSAGTLSSLVSSLFVTAIGSKLPRPAALFLSLCLTCGGLTLAFAATDGWMFGLSVALWAFGATMFTPYAFATTAQADPSGASTSLASALTGAGIASGPLLAGPFISHAGLHSVGWLGPVFLLAGFLVLASLAVRTRFVSVADANRTSA